MLPASQVDQLFGEMYAAEGYRLVIDLEACTVLRPNGESWSFEVDPFRRDCLLKGLDDIGITLERSDAIRLFEERHRDRFPWLFEDIVL